jgi:hypothetical protein
METQAVQGYWFTSIREIAEANERSGHHWFKAETLRYFGCRVSPTVYGGRYFVSSEQDTYGAWNYQRRYTVRMANENGTIETIGEFGQYRTRAQAVAASRQAVRQEAGK